MAMWFTEDEFLIVPENAYLQQHEDIHGNSWKWRMLFVAFAAFFY